VTLNGGTQDVSTGQFGDTVNVTVSVPVANITWIPGVGYLNGTITGTCVLPHE
jgi:hypothetical protein